MINVHGWNGTPWRLVPIACAGSLLEDFRLQNIMQPSDLFLEPFKTL
jgi:hypothetical protein